MSFSALARRLADRRGGRSVRWVSADFPASLPPKSPSEFVAGSCLIYIDTQGTYNEFTFNLIKLKQLNYRDYLRSNNPLAFALMAKMGYDKKQIVKLKIDFLRLIGGAKIDGVRRNLLVAFIDAYMPLNRIQKARFDEALQKEKQNPEFKAMLTSFEKRGIEIGLEKGRLEGLEQGREQGLEQGRAEGLEKGRVESKQDDLITILATRFGEIDAERQEQIRSITDLPRLDELLKEAITVESLDTLDLSEI